MCACFYVCLYIRFLSNSICYAIWFAISVKQMCVLFMLASACNAHIFVRTHEYGDGVQARREKNAAAVNAVQ